MTNFLPKLEHSKTKFPANFFHLLDHIVSLLVQQVYRKIAICNIVWQKWQPDLEMKTHTLVKMATFGYIGHKRVLDATNGWNKVEQGWNE